MRNVIVVYFFREYKKGKQAGRFLMLFLLFSIPPEDKKRTDN